jgi:hypothetical protein
LLAADYCLVEDDWLVDGWLALLEFADDEDEFALDG